MAANSTMDKVRVIFVLPEDCTDQDQASDVMLQAYESCKQNVVNVSWVKEEKFHTIDFSKTDFVIFQEFKGKSFESLKGNKCARILGPWCLLVCLMEGRPIPNFTWPIYNVAMAGCAVSCSHILKAKKLEIKEKVQLMGGCYTDSLMSTNTHLVTESVKSEKYLQAAESGLKIMVSTWVDAVWEASQCNNVHCNDEQFTKYRCLPFHNLTISSTGFPNVEMRQQLAQNVAKNGGVFTANLAVSTTDVLVVHGESGILSKKYKAARTNANIYCVSVDWINDSIEKGYALPHNLYGVTQKGTSTPTKDDEIGPNFSVISAIGEMTKCGPSTLEETVNPRRLTQPSLLMNMISPNKRKCAVSEEVQKLVDGLDIKKAKKAGQYLDGCSVYLAGFKLEHREKLSKILNLSGATRYEDISDRLTHIIIGDTTCPEVKIIKSKNYSVSLVSIQWLLASMEKQQAADEENYLINLHDFDKEQFSSPLGRKGLSLLRTNKTLTSNDIEAANNSTRNSADMEVDDELMQQYRRPASKNEDTDTLVRFLKNNSDFNSRQTTDSASTQNSELDDRTTQDTNIFYSKKFVLMNFSPEESQCLKQQIENVLGTVMSKNYKGIPDFVVTPLFIKAPIQTSAFETVTSLYINECIQECEELPVAYYHRPVVLNGSKPLNNCVVTISGYAGGERNFLKELIEALGGISQEQFARVLSTEKNVQASTHLVSLSAEGKKYMAALKWGLPVVTKEWLFECGKTGQLVSEEKFLMGDSKAPVRSLSESRFDTSRNKPGPSKLTPGVDRRATPSSASKNRHVLTTSTQMQPLNISKIEKTPTNRRLLEGETGTPFNINKKEKTPINQKTPVNQRLFQGVAETPSSQVTPINKLMEEVRKTNLLGTPLTPAEPKTWYDVETPDSPFGAFIEPHLSANSKKKLMRYINGFPDFVPPPKERKSTPLSEVKRRCWKKLLGQQDSPSHFTDKTEASTSHLVDDNQEIQDDDEDEKTGSFSNQENCNKSGDNNSEINTQSEFINTKLKQIEEMITAFGETRRTSRAFQSPVPAQVGNFVADPTPKDSQPFTVRWDYGEDSQPKHQEKLRIFIISGVENEQRQSIVDKIERLGGIVSELNSYDPKCSHLICPKPARNEKTLSCMASGKWILHISYVDKCISAGKFLPEEEFEFGNPKAKENIKVTFDKENEYRIQSIHWWRKEISRRGYGAFNDMRAIVVAQKRDPIIRVIEAGGGQVVDATPPFQENVHATHCLLELRSVPDFSVYNPLAQKGILCINTLYISDFLYRTNRDIKDAILPHFTKFYT